jgi:tRNA(Ile)-lysidine synthase
MTDPALRIELEAAHVHHGIRGIEADEDASFCRRMCEDLSLPFHLVHLPPEASMPAGREGTWRQARYRALAEVASDRRMSAVATGHQRDDVAEGVLLQLLRGGGPRALAGITTETSSGVIRPLLPWGRMEILAWLSDRGIAWREDSSNRDLGHLRNRVRHELLPELESASPSLRTHLVHFAEMLAADDRLLSNQLAEQMRWIEPWEPNGGVELAWLRGLPSPLRARWLHAQAARIGIDRVSRRQLQIFELMIGDGDPRAVTFNRRWRARLAGKQLWLEPPQPVPAYDFDLAVGQDIDLPLPGWRVRFVETSSPDDDVRWRWHPPIGASLRVRSGIKGDRVEVEDSSVPVRSLLSRALPRHLRWAWPVFCEDDRIYWIPGVWKAPSLLSGGEPMVEVIRR